LPMDAAVAAYRKKRDIVFDRLSSKFEVVKPEGAFYIFPRAPAGTNGTQFVTKAIEHNVLIIPGNVFSERDTHFRISYAATDEKLIQGCQILCSLVSPRQLDDHRNGVGSRRRLRAARPGRVGSPCAGNDQGPPAPV